jgi:hypothetical protein
MQIRTSEWSKLFFSRQNNCQLYNHFNNFMRAMQLKKIDLQIRLNNQTGSVVTTSFRVPALLQQCMNEVHARSFDLTNIHLHFERTRWSRGYCFGQGEDLPPFPHWYDCRICVYFTHRRNWIDRKQVALLMTSSFKYRWANTGTAT